MKDEVETQDDDSQVVQSDEKVSSDEKDVDETSKSE